LKQVRLPAHNITITLITIIQRTKPWALNVADKNELVTDLHGLAAMNMF